MYLIKLKVFVEAGTCARILERKRQTGRQRGAQ